MDTIFFAPAAAANLFTPEMILQWLKTHWLFLLLVFIAVIIIMIIIFSVIIPGIRKIIWKLKQRKETKKYSEELLLRKHLADVARGGKEGEEAEEQTLISYLAEIKAEISYARSIFKREHKSVYATPWYIMVGEPGAGKSSLIRHSSLDMPPEIVDMTQGESGTSTFHWWFTAKGIILDIGGRLFFNRWGGKGDSEWRYLLSRIKKMRKKCPLNGVIVTVPADSLLADGEELVRKKAKMIADEINVLQRTSGLSLPVYIIVTKMDFVPGFSEIFEELDTENRKSLFGCSPQSDSAFSSEELSKYFLSTSEKLKKYASARLLSVDFTSNSAAERMDYAKFVYTFPDAFLSLKDKLNIYMQSLFGLTNWSGNRLLLCRGIFFTAVRDIGIRFDKDVMDITGNEYKLPENKISESICPTFIYDIFMSKIFIEHGLVAFTKDAAAKKRFPLILLSGVLTVAAAILLFFSLIDKKALQGDVEHLRAHWDKFEKLFKNGNIQRSPVVEIDKQNTPQLLFLKPLDGNPDMSREAFLLALYSRGLRKYPLPRIYRFSQPWNTLYTNDILQNERLHALQLAYAEMVFLPTLESARFKIMSLSNNNTENKTALQWTKTDITALKTLLRMEVVRAVRENVPLRKLAKFKNFSFNVFFKFLFSRNFEDIKPRLGGQTYKKIFNADKSDYNIKNPASSLFYMLNTGMPQSIVPLNIGIKNFCIKWEQCSAEPELMFHAVKNVSDLLTEFVATEEAMDKIEKKLELDGNLSLANIQTILKDWDKEYKKLTTIAKNLHSYQEELKQDAQLKPASLLAKTAYDYSLKMHEAYETLLSVIKKHRSYIKPGDKFVSATYKKLLSSLKRAEINSQLTLMRIDNNMQKHLYDWTQQAYSRHKAYYDRYILYSTVAKKLTTKIHDVNIVNVSDVIDNMDKDAKDFLNFLASKKKNAKKDPIFCESISDMQSIFTAMHRLRRYQCYLAALQSVPLTDKAIAKLIKTKSATEEILPAPSFPLTLYSGTGTFDNSYHPDAAAKYLGAWQKLSEKLVGKKPDKNFVNRNEVLTKYREVLGVIMTYKRDYIQYWTRDVLDMADVKAYPSWKNFKNEVSEIKPYQINGSIQYLSQQAIYALKKIPITDKMLKQQIADATLFYQKQLSVLTQIFTRQSAICLEAWQSFPISAEKCCQRIIAMSDSKISDTLFNIYSTDNKSRLIWWNDFINEARESLKKHIADYVMTHTRTLAGSYMQFPLCNMQPRVPAMTLAQVQISANQLLKFLKMPKNINIKKDPKQKNALINGLINGIRPYYTLEDQQQRKWFEKISTVLNILNDNVKPLYWEMFLPDYDTSSKVPEKAEMLDAVPAAYRYRYFEIYLNGIKLGKRLATSTSDGKLLKLPSIHGYAYDSNLLFLFYEFVDSKEPGAAVAFNGNWAPLNLYLREEVAFDDKTKIHFVPFLFTDKKGYSCWFRIGMKFNRKIPMPSQWPTPDNWISFNLQRISVKKDVNRAIAIILTQTVRKDRKKEIVKAINSSVPSGAMPAWELYIPPIKQQLRIPITNTLNIKDYPQTSGISSVKEVPDAGVSLMRYMEIFANGRKITKRLETLNSFAAKNRFLNLKIPVNVKRLEFHFFKYANDTKPAKIVKLKNEYPVIEKLVSTGTVIEPNKNGFIFPIEIAESKTRKKYFYWLGVRTALIYR